MNMRDNIFYVWVKFISLKIPLYCPLISRGWQIGLNFELLIWFLAVEGFLLGCEIVVMGWRFPLLFHLYYDL